MRNVPLVFTNEHESRVKKWLTGYLDLYINIHISIYYKKSEISFRRTYQPYLFRRDIDSVNTAIIFRIPAKLVVPPFLFYP